MRSFLYAAALVVLAGCGGCLHAGDEVTVNATSGQRVNVEVAGQRRGVLARLADRRAPQAVGVIAAQPAAVAGPIATNPAGPVGILTVGPVAAPAPQLYLMQPVTPAQPKRIHVEVK